MDLLQNVFFYYINDIFWCNVSNVNPLKCASMNNQEWKIKTTIIDINNNETLFYLYSIKINKWSGNFNNINDPYATLCVPNVDKKINISVVNIMSRTNETKHIE